MGIKKSKDYILSVLTGPHKGSSYKIVSQSIIIGRSARCDIILKKDIKVSRRHMRISLHEKTAIIENLNHQNFIFVNNKECKDKDFLSYGSFFQLGDTRCQLKILEPSLAKTNQGASNALVDFQNKSEFQSENQNDIIPGFLTKNKKNKKIKIYIISILLIGFFIFLTQGNKDKKKPLKILSPSEIDAQIEANRNIAAALDKERNLKKKNSLQYREAFIHYTKGFRDYNKGFYRRSMISFQACLSIFQAHVMCKRYNNLARKKLYELIQYYMVQGKKYMSRYQFPACQGAYRNVMSMIQDRKNKTYQEARGYFLICKKKWKNRF